MCACHLRGVHVACTQRMSQQPVLFWPQWFSPSGPQWFSPMGQQPVLFWPQMLSPTSATHYLLVRLLLQCNARGECILGFCKCDPGW